MEAYLDNSATTCVYQETADLVCDLMVNIMEIRLRCIKKG